MDFAVFLRGLAIGFGIAAPVGPIGVLCIRRTLADGRAVGFAAIFAGLGLGTGAGGYGSASIMVLGVFLGSASWWLLLSTGVGFLRASITPAHLRWVNRVAAAIIAAFGVGALVSLLA